MVLGKLYKRPENLGLNWIIMYNLTGDIRLIAENTE